MHDSLQHGRPWHAQIGSSWASSAGGSAGLTPFQVRPAPRSACHRAASGGGNVQLKQACQPLTRVNGVSMRLSLLDGLSTATFHHLPHTWQRHLQQRHQHIKQVCGHAQAGVRSQGQACTRCKQLELRVGCDLPVVAASITATSRSTCSMCGLNSMASSNCKQHIA